MDICEQPELRLSSTLEFDPETTQTVNLPLTRPTSKTINPPIESDAQRPENDVKSSIQSELKTDTTETTPDTISPPPTESNNHQSVEYDSTACTKEAPTVSDDDGTAEATNASKLKTVFVFSTENIPSGCYYLTPPNKYVFPGSTHTWYGSGNADKDREEIFEEEDDDEFEIGFDYDYDDDEEDNDEEDDDDDEDNDEEDDDEANQVENSDSDHVIDDMVKPSETGVLGKRIGTAEIAESVSPVKQQKTNDDE